MKKQLQTITIDTSSKNNSERQRKFDRIMDYIVNKKWKILRSSFGIYVLYK